MLRDDLIRCLLLLYGLHPVDLTTRVQQALEKTRPYLKSHGGNVELVRVEDGEVHLRMKGSCHGCPSSAITLKLAIEQAIHEAAPDVTAIVVDDASGQPAGDAALVQLSLSNGRAPAAGAGWEDVSSLDDMGGVALRAVDVAGRRVIVCRVDESLYAYDDRCPACESALGDASLGGHVLTCASCSTAFDVVHAGRAFLRGELHLDPFPLLVEGGRVRVAMPAALPGAAS
jgi:Fe-S cluster biogenesis protein NfuA/nitrite reductase/ring-hydroxylating ferredoxin subunit